MIEQELWDIFKEHFSEGLRWCEKRHKAIFVKDMSLEECNACQFLITKGGICDPL